MGPGFDLRSTWMDYIVRELQNSCLFIKKDNELKRYLAMEVS